MNKDTEETIPFHDTIGGRLKDHANDHSKDNTNDIKNENIENSQNNVQVFSCKTCGKSFGDGGFLQRHIFYAHEELRQQDKNVDEKVHEDDSKNESKKKDSKKNDLETIDSKNESKKNKSKKNDFETIKNNIRKGINDTNACELCGKFFTEKARLLRHIEGVHEGLKKHTCDICKKNFHQKINLKSHIAKTHVGLKGFKCIKKLTEKTKQILKMKNNSKIIKKEKPRKNLTETSKEADQKKKLHICKLCKKAFGMKSNLKRHNCSVHKGINSKIVKNENAAPQFKLSGNKKKKIDAVKNRIRYGFKLNFKSNNFLSLLAF